MGNGILKCCLKLEAFHTLPCIRIFLENYQICIPQLLAFLVLQICIRNRVMGLRHITNNAINSITSMEKGKNNANKELFSFNYVLMQVRQNQLETPVGFTRQLETTFHRWFLQRIEMQ